MPHASSRLDLYLCVRQPNEAQLESVAERMSARASELVEGGVRGVRPLQFPEGRLVANQQGGYRVRCPQCEQNAVPALHRALGGWRSGEPPVLSCDHCGYQGDVGTYSFRPAAAWCHGAIWLVDVAHHELSDVARALASELGDYELVLRRT